MAGSILAGWAVEPGRYQPVRWALAGCWAVGHTDRGRGWSATGASEGTGRPVYRVGDGQAGAEPADHVDSDPVAHEPVAGGAGQRSVACCRRPVAHGWSGASRWGLPWSLTNQ